MPIYDYVCANCGHVVEAVHGVHDAGPTTCPQCGGLLRKRLSTPAIHFRGSGWAKKDAREASGRQHKPGKPAERTTPAGTAGKTASADAGASAAGSSDAE